MASAAAGAVGVAMVAVSCGATAIAALLLSQHEKQDARLAEALRLLAQKEEQLQQACYERSRLNDQLAADRAARVAERSASSVGASAVPADGQHPEAPKALPLDPRLLGLMPSRPSSSASPQAPSTKSTGEKAMSTAEPASQFDVANPSCNGAPHSAAAELAELRQADVEGAVQFLHVSESINAPAAPVELLTVAGNVNCLDSHRSSCMLRACSDTTCPSTRQYSDDRTSRAATSAMCLNQTSMVSQPSRSSGG